VTLSRNLHKLEYNTGPLHPTPKKWSISHLRYFSCLSIWSVLSGKSRAVNIVTAG